MNAEMELLKYLNRIRPEFYEDFEDVNGMVFHNGAELADGKVCFYRPQTKSGTKVIFLHLFVILFTGGACVVAGGACVVVCGEGGCVGYEEIRSMSGRYASYWKAFLFFVFFVFLFYSPDFDVKFRLLVLMIRRRQYCSNICTENRTQWKSIHARSIGTVSTCRIRWSCKGLTSIPQQIHWIQLKHLLLSLCTTCRYRI